MFDPALLVKLRKQPPELPEVEKARFVADYKLSPYDAGVLVSAQARAAYFETVALLTAAALVPICTLVAFAPDFLAGAGEGQRSEKER